MTYIGKLIRDTRMAQNLTERDLIFKAGYRKINKGLRRLQEIESGRDPLPADHRMRPFAKALGLSEEDMLAALCADFEVLDRPTPPSVVIRWLPAFYGRLELPDGCAVEQAVERAKAFSTRTGLRCCVTLSRIRCIYVEPDGSERLSFSPPGSWLALSAGLRDKVMLMLAKRLAKVPMETAR